LIYILSSILCFIGIGFLSFEKNLTINFGDFLTFICAICFALQIVVIGSRIKNKNPFTINGFQMFSAGIIGILLNIIFEGATIFTRTYELKQILALVYIILFNTFICYSIQTYAQKEINPSQVSLILTTEIIFGALFSVLLLGDKMTFQVIIGGLLIFTSILLTEVKKR
ncbi:MAG: DMT family transporter, partial [Cetobacterium sp.]